MLNQHMHSIFTSTRYSSRDQAHIAFTWQNLLEGNSKLVLEGADDRDRRIAELEDDVNDRDDRIADLKAENSMLRAQAQIPAPLSAASPTSPFRGAMHSALQKQQRGAPSSSSSSAPVAGISRSGGTPGLFDSTPFGPFTSPLLPGWVLPPGMLSPYLNDGSTPTLGSLATTPMQGVQMQEQEQEEQRQGASFSSFASLAAAGAGAPSDPEAPPAKRPSPSKPVEVCTSLFPPSLLLIPLQFLLQPSPPFSFAGTFSRSRSRCHTQAEAKAEAEEVTTPSPGHCKVH